MRKTATPGSKLPATLGGEGWRPRAGNHAEDVAGGRVWHCCGVQSEVAPLREVLLSWPGTEMEFAEAPDRWLMLERVELVEMQRQTEALVRFYQSQGVGVHLYRPSQLPTPNLIFMRDLFFMTPQGALLARMASEQRAGEERHAALALAQIGVPVVGFPRGNSTFEGADALWMDGRTVLVGRGRRTNTGGVRFLRDMLECEVVVVELPPAVQHLLGVVNFVDTDLAVARRDRLTGSLRRVLRGRGVEVVELEPTEEVTRGLAMNFVTLRPRRVVMPAGCPHTRRILEAAGVECLQVDVSQYLRAAGGIGCLTGILQRN